MVQRMLQITLAISSVLLFVLLPINSYILKLFVSITFIMWSLLLRDRVVSMYKDYDYDESKNMGKQAVLLTISSLGLFWICTHVHNIW